MTTGKTSSSIQNFVGKVPFAVPYHSIFTRSQKTIYHMWESSWVEGLYESPSVQARTEWCPSLPCLSPALYSSSTYVKLWAPANMPDTSKHWLEDVLELCSIFPVPLPNFQGCHLLLREIGAHSSTPASCWLGLLENYGVCALARL